MVLRSQTHTLRSSTHASMNRSQHGLLQVLPQTDRWRPCRAGRRAQQKVLYTKHLRPHPSTPAKTHLCFFRNIPMIFRALPMCLLMRSDSVISTQPSGLGGRRAMCLLRAAQAPGVFDPGAPVIPWRRHGVALTKQPQHGCSAAVGDGGTSKSNARINESISLAGLCRCSEKPIPLQFEC